MNNKHSKLTGSTSKITNELLGDFSADRVPSKIGNNHLLEMERERRLKFDKITVTIPWYLKPFSKVVKSMAYNAFCDGLSVNGGDVVTFKRPSPYIADAKYREFYFATTYKSGDKVSFCGVSYILLYNFPYGNRVSEDVYSTGVSPSDIVSYWEVCDD